MKKRQWMSLICTGFVLFFSGYAPAEEQSAGEQKAVQLKEVIVTASKVPKTPGNVTQKVNVIDREELDSIVVGKGNAAELITYEPGVYVSVLSRNDANWGSSGGLSQKYNTYMLDGLPIDAFVEPQSLSPNAFERIELQRGPAAVLYPNYLSMDFAGNQSPLTGTTNIILKDRIDRDLSDIDLYYGSYNTMGTRFYQQRAADNLHLFFGGDYESSDYTDYGTSPSWLNMKDDPEYEKSKLYLRSTLFINDRKDHKLSFFVQHTDHTGDAGRPNRDFNHDYWTLNAAYALPIGNDLTANLKVGSRIYDRLWEEDGYPADLSLSSENSVEQRIIPADLSFSYEHSKGALLTAGVDYQSVSYKTFSETAGKTPGNDATALQSGVYLQEELPVSDFLFRAGLRYSYTRHEIDLLSGALPGNDEEDWEKILWSAGASYNPRPELSLYTNVGTSFVAPSLLSVGGTLNSSDRGVSGRNGRLPNPDLEPESGIGYDLGIDLKPVKTLTLGVRGFYNLIDDQIVQVVVSEDPSQSQDINAGDTASYGVELSMTHKPLNWLSWFANYTYTQTEISNDTDPDQDGAQVPFVPEHMGNIGSTLTLPVDLEASLYLHVAGEIYDSSSKSGRTEFDSYELLNAKVRKGLIKRPTYNVDAYLDLYNLTNKEFKMPWQFQDPGFSAIGGVKVFF